MPPIEQLEEDGAADKANVGSSANGAESRASTDLHAAIMNLEPRRGPRGTIHTTDYLIGHRDARHAAAKLALRSDAINAELLEVCRLFVAYQEAIESDDPKQARPLEAYATAMDACYAAIKKATA